MNNLKSCPFCGSRAEVYKSEFGFSAGCKDKTCIGRHLHYYDLLSDAVEAWNKRTNPAKIQAAVDKQIPKPLIKEGLSSTCSVCGHSIRACFPHVPRDFQYCSNCGQKVMVNFLDLVKCKKEFAEFLAEMDRLEHVGEECYG